MAAPASSNQPSCARSTSPDTRPATRPSTTWPTWRGINTVSPLTAASIGYVAAFYGMFQHWNVRTPQWLGYVIQRPESHGLHHELGVQRQQVVERADPAPAVGLADKGHAAAEDDVEDRQELLPVDARRLERAAPAPPRGQAEPTRPNRPTRSAPRIRQRAPRPTPPAPSPGAGRWRCCRF